MSGPRKLVPAVVVCFLVLCLSAGAGLAQVVEFPCTGEAFIVQTTTADLFEVDQTGEDFEFTLVAEDMASYEINNLGFDRAAGLLCGWHRTSPDADPEQQVVSIDATGLVISQGTGGLPLPLDDPTTDRFNAGDVAPDGSLFYLNQNGRVGQPIYTLDVPPLTLANTATIMGDDGRVSDWAAHPSDGMLYGGDDEEGELAVLDPATGDRTDKTVDGCNPVSATCDADSLPTGIGYGGAWFRSNGDVFLFQNCIKPSGPMGCDADEAGCCDDGSCCDFCTPGDPTDDDPETNCDPGKIFQVENPDGMSPQIVRTRTGPSSRNNDAAACIPPPEAILGISKNMELIDASVPGTLVIEYTIENFGTESLINLTAEDDLTVPFGGTPANWTFTSISSMPAAFANPGFDGDADVELINQAPTQSLAPGTSATITVTIELLVFLDPDADGQLCNVVTVIGLSDPSGVLVGDVSSPGNPDPNESQQTCIRQAGLTLTKTGALDLGGDGIANPGDVITYEFVVENTGDVDLTDVLVTDNMVSPITCPSGNPIPLLAVGESETCTGTYEITQADIDAGEKCNTATAESNETAPVTADHCQPIPQPPPEGPPAIPTLSSWSLAGFALLLLGLGFLALRRRLPGAAS